MLRLFLAALLFMNVPIDDASAQRADSASSQSVSQKAARKSATKSKPKPTSKAEPVKSDTKELPAGFVDVATLIPDIVIDLRYATPNNFVGQIVDGYKAQRCILTRRAAEALAAVQRDLAERGLGLKLFDCYRPVRAVAHFMKWAKDVNDTATKATYYPAIDKQDLVKEGYIAARSAHSRGSTVDLTLVRLANKIELDMGTPFDFFSPKSWPSDTSVSHDAQFNRRMLFEAMNRRGFRDYEKEWWHFTLVSEPHPTRMFDFVIE